MWPVRRNKEPPLGEEEGKESSEAAHSRLLSALFLSRQHSYLCLAEGFSPPASSGLTPLAGPHLVPTLPASPPTDWPSGFSTPDLLLCVLSGAPHCFHTLTRRLPPSPHQGLENTLQTSSHSVPDVSPPGNTRFPRPSISACISQSSPSARASSASFPAAPGPTHATLVLLAMTHSQCFTYTPTHGGTWGRAHMVSCLLIANVAQEHTQLLAATHTAAGSHINTHTHTSHKSHHRHTHSLTPGHCHMLCVTRAHSLGDTLAAKCVGHGGCRARSLGAHPQVPEEGGTAAIVPPQRVGAAGALPTDLVAEAGFSPRQAPRRYGALAAPATAWGEEGLDGV